MTKKVSPKDANLSMVETYHIVLPSHANALGSVFGGTIMGWIDIAAAICAQRYSERVCVTASIDALNFLSPIQIGDTVHLCARVVYTGRTSMMVRVAVTHENIRHGSRIESALAYLTFVALDENRKPTSVPALELKTAAEKEEFEAAARRRESLLSQRKT